MLIERQRDFLRRCEQALRPLPAWQTEGRLTRVTGLVMEAVGLKLPVGNGCYVLTPSGQRVDAEVVGFSGERLFLMPSTDIRDSSTGSTTSFSMTSGAAPSQVSAMLTTGKSMSGFCETPRRRS